MAWNEFDLGESYDYVSFSLPTGQTNYDVRANQSALWSNISIAQQVVIDTTQTISIRFNRTAYAAVTLDVSESPMELLRKLNIRNIYLTNASGSASTIKIWLFT